MLTQNLIDTHAHMDEIGDIDHVIKYARSSGIDAIIAVGQNIDSNEKTFAIARTYQGFVYPSIGLHPWYIGKLTPLQIEDTIEYIKHNLKKAVALGEVGLDYDKRVLKTAGKEIQKSVLRRLLQIALDNNKPVSLHSRYAWHDSLVLVKVMGVTKLVFHWYTGMSSTLSSLVDAGYYISATPAAEYHDEHRRAIRETPVDRLLLETDCPVYYGRENKYQSQPSDAIRSLKAAAEVKHLDHQELALYTTMNARKLFAI